MNEILYKIKHLRELLNLSQDQMAMNLDISRSTYSRLENGKSPLTVSQLLILAACMKVSPGDLLTKPLGELANMCV